MERFVIDKSNMNESKFTKGVCSEILLGESWLALKFLHSVKHDYFVASSGLECRIKNFFQIVPQLKLFIPDSSIMSNKLAWFFENMLQYMEMKIP